MHQIDGHRPANLHSRWTRENRPIARIRSGDRLEALVPDSSTGQLSPSSVRRDLAAMDYAKVDAAVGPVEVVGARPGDALVVEVESIAPASWGWTGIFREFGLLQGRFDDDLVIWALDGRSARPVSGFLRPVDIPLRPMLGWLGTAPAEGDHPMIPPRRTGGNLDNPLLQAGSVLRLPVEVPGALLSRGDPHARQGAGEVCGTGIETPARAVLRVELEPGRAPPFPSIEVNRRGGSEEPVFAAMGVAPDLKRASRLAVEHLLTRLVDGGWTPPEAYVLASVVGDLEISELVDEPNFVVTMTVPKRLVHPDSGTSLPHASARVARSTRTRQRLKRPHAASGRAVR